MGLTLDFKLRKHLDYAAAYHLLTYLLTTNILPERLVTDQYCATLKAVKHLIKQELFSKSTHQCSNIEIIRLSNVETIHAIRKTPRRDLSLIGFSVVDELEVMIAASA